MNTIHSWAPLGPHASTEAAQPARPTTRREPEFPGLTPDEIRRIVLDLIG